MSASERSVISEWYSSRNILITGATGFMGKVLVEKLLRSCPNLGTIYLIVRPKRGLRPEERLNTIVNTPLFDLLRRENPDALNKIVIMKGDITAPEVGLSATDKLVLTENISVVFHSAATVKFDEALRTSVAMNIVGTQQLIKLSYQMKKLEAFVHVSTAYSNCHLSEIDEKIYPSPTNIDKLIECVQCLDDDIMEEITPKLLGNRPNTYTFTKALAEQLVADHAGALPLSICRPSIVTSSWREPIPAWVDTVNGPTGLMLGAGKGILKSVLAHRPLVADIIPVDIVINLMICIAWHTTINRSETVPVYNCASGVVNPVRWGTLEVLGQRYLREYPQTGLFWYPTGSFKSSRFLHQLSDLLFHVLPAYLVDLCVCAAGRKPLMVKVQRKLAKAMKSLEYFTTKDWQFNSTNVPKLYGLLSEADRQLFNFDIADLNWDDYMRTYTLGIRRFILNDTDDTLPAARAHLRRMKYLHYAIQILFLILLWKFFVHGGLILDIFWTCISHVYTIFSSLFTR